MVTFLSLRKCAVISLGLCLLLGGCNNAGTSTTAPEAPASSPAPAASPALKSATPNSFDDVTAQLDPGGDFYLYLSTAQWLGKLSKGIDTLHDLILSGSGAQSLPDTQKAGQGFAVLKDIIQKSGLEDITGLGASSIALAPDLFRNKIFVHHYPDKGAGILWSLYGTAPHPLSALDFLPADTALAGFGDFDLAQLVTFLRQEASQSGIPELNQAVAQWQTQFAGLTGLQLDDVLGSLNGSMGMVLTLDATTTISIPIAAQPQTIPAPRLALLIAVKNDLVFKQVDKMLAGNPAVVKVDQPGLQMRTMSIPIMPALGLLPTVAQWNGFLIIASDDKIVRDMVAVQGGAPGIKSTAEFATLSAGLPQQGNSFGLSTQRFFDTLRQVQGQMLANQPGSSAAQAALMQRLISRYQKAGHMFAVGSLMPNGWLSVSQGSQGSSQMLAPMLIAPAAILAGLALPAFTGVREKALETKSMSNAKQLGLACKQYAIDNNGNFPPSLDALFPTYLTDRSILGSPLMPGDPAGYIYTPGLKDTDPADTILIEDKFAPLKHIRIVVYVDDSAKILRTP